MRILYHHRTLGDGAEGIHIEEMVNAFRSLGHEVRVMGLAAGDATHRRGWIARVRSALPRLVFEIATIATNVLEYRHVRRAIREFQPDVVYKRHARNDIGATRAARRAGVPLVLEVNCLFTGAGYREFEPMALEWVAAWCERRALLDANVCVAVSSPLAHQIAQCAGVTALVVPNGADPARFDPALQNPVATREQHGLGSSTVVGWVGVLRDWHGLDELLEAVAPLHDVRVLIVGDGPARVAFEAKATALGMTDRLVVTGRVPHADVSKFVATMDVAVVANDRTGVASPMKLLEYMAMGRAVVAPALANIQDVLTDGVEGVLFPPGDAGALSATVRRLVGEPALRARLGQAARRAIVDHRNWRSIAARILAALPPGRQAPTSGVHY